jgi:hypothetical protein
LMIATPELGGEEIQPGAGNQLDCRTEKRIIYHFSFRHL